MLRAPTSQQCAECAFDSGPVSYLGSEFVVGSRLALWVFFLGSLVYLPPQKPTSLNSNLTKIKQAKASL